MAPRHEAPSRRDAASAPGPGTVSATGRVRRGTALATALICGAVLSGCAASPGGGAPDTARRTTPARPAPSPTSSWNPRPASVAAVGDSITRGFDTCELLADCPEASWATGSDTRVNSLALRLLGAPALASRSWNLARSGARVAELPGQMELAAERKPDLVAVMVGANDACRPSADLMTPVADFRASFEAAMARLRRAAPRTQVYVASIPDLRRLWSTGRGHPVGRRVWSLGVCASMLADAHDTGPAAEERRGRVRERVVAYNGVLRDVCARDERCRHDGGAVFAYPFAEAQLSPWDVFHPSRDGQGKLAEIAYRTVTSGPPA
ncbi:GDSL-type esterase/lipase family protein [Streptomyces somaliensis]|uniref:GDSL-type esterase/lipase family protein n=1 Tax=Streptomyces somaliensis TaxID=78355 RepID=UPI002815011C|nr:GDSL-type esterase/lipase family protein [Streptomyces somaliensis]